MKLKLAFIIIACAVTTISCNRNKVSDASPVADLELSSLNKYEDKVIAADSTAIAQPPTSQAYNAGQPNAVWDKKIIKTADVRLEVDDYSSYNASIHKQIKNYGAYIANEEQTQSESGIENIVVIKVPVDKFEDLMNTFSGKGIKVVQRKISTTDVTDEVVDTKGRIEAKKQARDRYLQLLSQAKNMKEILEVQTELNSLQEDLEAASGRVNYLVHQASYSTINLTYSNFNTVIDEEPGFFTKVVLSFKTGSSIVAGTFLFLISIWPLIVGGLIAWYVVKKWSRSFLRVRSPK